MFFPFLIPTYTSIIFFLLLLVAMRPAEISALRVWVYVTAIAALINFTKESPKALAWDILSTVPDDYRLICTARISFVLLAYFLAR